jgi:hypothetical protein
MAKKTRLSKDAFDWVKDTSKEAEEDTSKEKEKEKTPKKKKPAATKPKAKKPAEKKGDESQAGVTGRTVLIRYQKNGGIVAIAEIGKEEANTETSYLDAPGGEKAVVFNLDGNLAGLRLIEIHNRYQVDVSGKKPKLVLKK